MSRVNFLQKTWPNWLLTLGAAFVLASPNLDGPLDMRPNCTWGLGFRV